MWGLKRKLSINKKKKTIVQTYVTFASKSKSSVYLVLQSGMSFYRVFTGHVTGIITKL